MIRSYQEMYEEFPLVQGRFEAKAVGKSLLARENRGKSNIKQCSKNLDVLNCFEVKSQKPTQALRVKN